MAVDDLIEALRKLGCHQTDIGDAFYDADPNWLVGLDLLHAPCSVIYGEEDTVPTFVAQEYRALLPNPVVIGLDHCGHFPWMEEEAMFWRAFAMAIEGALPTRPRP